MTLAELDFTRPALSRVRLAAGLTDSLPQRLKEMGAGKVAVIADETVLGLHGVELLGPLHEAGFEGEVHEVTPGELSKSRGTVAEIQDRLLESGIDRSGVIVGFGGGVTLDIAGYVAATVLRGIRWVSVPSSLLAQVDAGIGGKTGVNAPAGKNLIGAFHPPAEVLIDPDLLQTLQAVEWRNGLAEVVKHAWIADAELFDKLRRQRADLSTGPGPDTERWLTRAVEVKTAIVADDPFERGRRAVLNAGHTVGHAIEAASGHRIKHGFAVAAGLLAEAHAALELTGLSEADRTHLGKLLAELELLPETADLAFDDLLPFLKTDKKNVGGEVHLALPERLGVMAQQEGRWTHPVPLELLREAWESRL
jgi:3-dehydroquinate synthase